MFDELERLRTIPELFQLLGHYVVGAAPDRDAWQDRLMELPGVDARALARLHGELIAYGWIEMNQAPIVALQPGKVPSCYRLTPAGKRAYRQVNEGAPVYEEELPLAS